MLAWVLRILRISNLVNWIFGGLFLLLTGFLLLNGDEFRAALITEFSQGPDAAQATYIWLIGTGVALVPIIPLVHIILTKLCAIVKNAQDMQTFSTMNARRLIVIAWALLAINVIDLAHGYLSTWASAESGEYFGWTFSLTGWFAVLLIFVLARIFREGAAMRDDLEGTV